MNVIEKIDNVLEEGSKEVEVWKKTITMGKSAIVVRGEYKDFGEKLGGIRATVKYNTVPEDKTSTPVSGSLFSESRLASTEEASKKLKAIEKSFKVK